MAKEEKIILEIKNPKTAEETPQAMSQVFAALFPGGHIGLIKRLWTNITTLSFEIASFDQIIHFYTVIPKSFQTFFESQITSQYPQLVITPEEDFMDKIIEQPFLALGKLELAHSYYYPIKTYKDFRELDPLSSIVGVLSKSNSQEVALIQICIEPPHFNWQQNAQKTVEKGMPDPTAIHPDKTKNIPYARLIEEKATQNGYKTTIRILTGTQTDNKAVGLLSDLAGSFGAFATGQGNRFVLKRPKFAKKAIFNKIVKRGKISTFKNQILNTDELATIWHPPGKLLSGIRNISWGKTLLGEPPENLPVAIDISDEDKRMINFFARTEYRNKLTTFGIKKKDRRKHIYVIGKTGTGKSTLIANMAINDMKNKEGLAVIDPHGDLSEILLNYIPSHRINDTVYLEPFNKKHPFWLNPLEIKNQAQKELVTSGIVSIFYKLYAHSWGPRLEYILRNTILTLVDYPNSTLTMVPEILSNKAFREKVLKRMKDKTLLNFWINEYDKMSERLRTEAISPIQNKVGQFVTSPTIRQIIGHPKSTIDLEDIMNNGKILILNLSQGKLGEDNAALLGAMFITKIQLAAMNRAYMKEEDRRDFYLYVDEFQNFATSSFIKILSEARKYRLNLMMANQYIGQVEEDVQKAIFGNAGTLMSFVIGAQDARSLSREFGQWYKEEDMVSLGSYQIIIKLSIDDMTSVPFHAITLPLPKSINKNREKVIKVSRERYTKSPYTKSPH